jgi:hypothetical protein
MLILLAMALPAYTAYAQGLSAAGTAISATMYGIMLPKAARLQELRQAAY